MFSLGTLITSIIISAVAGFIVGIAVYRKNTNTIGKIADGIDEIVDKED